MSEWIWQPDPEAVKCTNVWRFMQRLGFSDREEFLRYSTDCLESFWQELLKEIGVDWFQAYDRILDTTQGVEWATWFNGGRLNIAHNCLERHVATGGVAIVSESEDGAIRELTFAELQREVNRLANALHAVGSAEGDRVALCMPMVPEVVVILYACFKLGLIAVPVFAGFGAGAIATRLDDSSARLVFTADHLERRGKIIPLKAKVDEALEKCSSVDRCIVMKYRGEADPPWNPERDEWWHDFTRDRDDECPSLPMDSESRAHDSLHLGDYGQAEGCGPHARGGTGAGGEGDLPCLRPSTRRPVFLAVGHWLDDGPLDRPRQSQLRRHHLSLRRRARLPGTEPAVGNDRAASDHDVWRFSNCDSIVDAHERSCRRGHEFAAVCSGLPASPGTTCRIAGFSRTSAGAAVPSSIFPEAPRLSAASCSRFRFSR